MRIRLRALGVGAAVAVGLALFGGGPVAVAATAATSTTSAPAGHHAEATSSTVMDYYQYFGHYTTQEECVAVGEEYLWPHNPGGADAYECRAKDDGWDLWLIFAT
ncbi:hypothetical protein ACWDSL_05710 [Streptomyces sp. NPDC000941]